MSAVFVCFVLGALGWVLLLTNCLPESVNVNECKWLSLHASPCDEVDFFFSRVTLTLAH